MRSCAICLFINLFVCFITNGQTTQQIASFKKPEITGYSLTTSILVNAGKTDTTNALATRTAPFVFMASNYYTSRLGFFCRKELQIEKALNFPVKFRLGSVAYTDKMEGKGEGVLTSK